MQANRTATKAVVKSRISLHRPKPNPATCQH